MFHTLREVSMDDFKPGDKVVVLGLFNGFNEPRVDRNGIFKGIFKSGPNKNLCMISVNDVDLAVESDRLVEYKKYWNDYTKLENKPKYVLSDNKLKGENKNE
jgi:hypothetical protein